MRVERAPATVVVCCGVPSGIGPSDFAGWVNVAERARVPVSWAARPADLPTVLDVLGARTTPFDAAVALDASQLSSRPTLRREIAAARASTGRIECAVAAGAAPLDHRALLVEQGIHTIAVGGFDAATRSSRRPPPSGWACRSVVWGLWEVQTVTRPPRSTVGRILPWAFGPHLPAGSLTVVHVEPGALGLRFARTKFERLTVWIARQADSVHAARLSDLQSLLQAAGQRETGSVLRRAA